MNLHPPRMWLPPDPPDQAELDAFKEQARAMRDDYAAARPARLAVLATGPALRDIDKAADCRCSCHPRSSLPAPVTGAASICASATATGGSRWPLIPAAPTSGERRARSASRSPPVAQRTSVAPTETLRSRGSASGSARRAALRSQRSVLPRGVVRGEPPVLPPLRDSSRRS